MASMTIRHLDDRLKTRLRAAHGRSMEDEAREILRAALSMQPPPLQNLAKAIQLRIKPLGGVNLDIAPREAIRDPMNLG